MANLFNFAGGNWYTRDQTYEFLPSLGKGDMVEFDRGLYSHWGIYAGISEESYAFEPAVIHRVNDADDQNKGIIAVQPLIAIWKNSRARVSNYLDVVVTPYQPEEVVARARRRHMIQSTAEHPEEYGIMINNCEHFATWCRYGMGTSWQVCTASILAGVTVLGFLGIADVIFGRIRPSRQQR